MKTTEIIYPIPLSKGVIVTVKLPVNLSAVDADKISKVVFSLVNKSEKNYD